MARAGVATAAALAAYGAIVSVIHVQAGWPLWLLLLIGLPVLNWAGRPQAQLSFLGVVVNPTTGMLYYPPALATLGLGQWLAVYPVVQRLTRPAWLPLGAIECMTRQAGKRLFLHGDFGSVYLNFSDKLKRDECIHVIRAARQGALPEEADYEYGEVAL